MTEKKNGTVSDSESNSVKQVETPLETVDVGMVMRGAEKVKSKYELLYEDILADAEEK